MDSNLIFLIFLFFSSIKGPDDYEYDFAEKPTYYKGISDLYEELPNEAIILNTIGKDVFYFNTSVHTSQKVTPEIGLNFV